MLAILGITVYQHTMMPAFLWWVDVVSPKLQKLKLIAYDERLLGGSETVPERALPPPLSATWPVCGWARPSMLWHSYIVVQCM